MSSLLTSDHELTSDEDQEQFSHSEEINLENQAGQSLVDDITRNLENVHAQKISIRLQPIGSTERVHPNTFSVSSCQTVASVLSFLIRRLRLSQVHLYILSSFQPTPDENLGELFTNFNNGGFLLFHYCESIAYG